MVDEVMAESITHEGRNGNFWSRRRRRGDIATPQSVEKASDASGGKTASACRSSIEDEEEM